MPIYEGLVSKDMCLRFPGEIGTVCKPVSPSRLTAQYARPGKGLAFLCKEVGKLDEFADSEQQELIFICSSK